MLVRFLSFVASVIGTARYKAALLSSLALILSLTGITAVALTKESVRPYTSAGAVEPVFIKVTTR